jgi:Na+/melibiose symporter-like transporter
MIGIGVTGVGEREEAEGRRNARLYLIGLGTSLIGNSALSLVAGIWVKSLTGSSGEAGLVSACIYLPSMCGPLAGLVVDRLRRRPFLVAVNLASAAAVLPLLLVRSAAEVWVIYVVMVGYGISLILIDPAESALFAVMLSADIRQRANGIRLALQEGGKLIAPLAGAGLFALLGGGAVAAADAGSFVVAAFVLTRLRLTEPRPVRERRRWAAEMTAGLANIWQGMLLRITVIAGAVAMFVSGMEVAAQYSLVAGLHRPPAFLGVFSAALGAGSIIAALMSSRLVTRFGEPVLAMLGLVNGAIGNVLLTVGGGVAVALAGFFVLGFALPWTVVAVINISQRLTPSELQGRVAAAMIFLLFAPQPLAQAAGSAIIGQVSYRAVYLGAALAWLTTAAWLGARARSARRHAESQP